MALSAEDIKQIRDTIQAELQLLMSEINHYDQQRKDAKTSTKRSYFSKKIEKTNQLVVQRVVALQRLDDREKAMKLIVNEPQPVVNVAQQVANEPQQITNETTTD